MPGPPPKRESQRRRTNKPATPVHHAVTASKVRVPRADPKWHPVAKRWYESLRASGQAQFYEASDWATAFVVAESMSREFADQVVGTTESGELIKASLPPKAASIAAWLKAATSLMVTEGDRRRLRLELDRPLAQVGEKASGNVSWLEDARRRRESGDPA